MRNQYTKFIKYLEKSDSVFFQCHGSSVYLTDGKIAIKTPKEYYNDSIALLSGILPVAGDDVIGCKRNESKRIIFDDNGFDIEKVFNSVNADHAIYQSQFIIQLDKKKFARVFFCDGSPVFIDDNFIKIFNDVSISDGDHTGGRYFSRGGKSDAIIKMSDDKEFCIMMLPLRVDIDKILDETQGKV